jgi:TonB family protein
MALNRPSRFVICALFWFFFLASIPGFAAGNEPMSETRKIKVRVNPAYPDIARLMNLSGNVNLMVTVAPDGTVKDCHPLGGHPILIEAATSAVKKWRYEPAAQSSTIPVTLKFDRQQ